MEKTIYEAIYLIKLTDSLVIRALETGTTPSRELTSFRNALFDVVEGRATQLPANFPQELAVWEN